MRLKIEPYATQKKRWPRSGRHILAGYDDESVVVYQAYRPTIGHFAAREGRFGGEFSLNRMSWIKPNFLWMMYRCGWATKADQEVVLAVTLRRAAFDAILAEAVHSHYVPEAYESQEHWKAAVAASSVRLQWDPDHDPSGAPVERRAIQLGLRGEFLRRYAGEWIVGIEDITDFVREQRERAAAPGHAGLVTPSEAVYPVPDGAVAVRLGISPLAEEPSS